MASIRSYDELTALERAQAPALDWADGDPPSLPQRIHSVGVPGQRIQSYEALYLVDKAILRARVASLRLAFRTDRRSETVCGIADVVTRPDSVRHGHARTLLREAHRRARADGIQWSFLWTRRSWGAHRAYEQEGYRDVYSPPVALRWVPRPGARRELPDGFSLRPARRSDAELLESLLARATRHRLGFVPRAPSSFAVRFRIGWRRPGDHWILSHHGTPVGYAHAVRSRFDTLCRELLSIPPHRSEVWLRALETITGGKWLGLNTTTFVRDHRPPLERSGYVVVPSSHGVLMACPLTSKAAARWAELRRTLADPRFSCHGGDMF